MKKGIGEEVRLASSVMRQADRQSARANGVRPGSPKRRQLTSAERHKLLFEWNQTHTEYPRDRCLHHLIEDQVERSPDSVAVESESGALTYRTLNDRANSLAHQLQSLGVAPDILVGVCLEPSSDLLVALLAVMKSGGAYVPLDASYPKQRLTFMVRDSGMRIAVTQKNLRPTFFGENIQSLCVEDTSLDDVDSGNPKAETSSENLAYVIYTSGSTGRPKGVMVTHRGLVNYLVWAAEAYELKKGSGAPVHSSISFDLTITGLFAPLLAGRAVKILPQNLEALSQALQSPMPFSLVKITPAHLELLCAQWIQDARPAATRFFVVGGEALFGQSLDFCQRCAPSAKLVNEYGPTETVVGCCVYFVPPNRTFDVAIPIGRPIANTQLYILDERLEPVPIGGVGELYIGGDGLARGYLNQPELTAARFIPNPFTAEDPKASARIYKTGDLARYLPDGNLEFLGRADDQIKLRGYRIEPAEIEAALVNFPHIRNAAVIGLTSAGGDKYLAAYLIQNGETPDPIEMREYLKTRLPDYMVPSVFVVLPELPLTANGKVNRRALPPPEHKRGLSNTAASATERRVAELWSDALQHRVGLDDNFFDLGGYSLLAVRLVAQMNDLFHTRLDALSFYQHPTVREVAHLLEQGGQTSAARLICLRRGRSESPVIFLNAPLEFVRMIDLMTEEHPFYISEVAFSEGTIEAALRFDTSAFPELEKMIAPHVELILSSNLRGPIFLAGYSSYGVVAFEVAHRLQQAGRKVGGIFLLDADMKAARWAELRVRTRRHARNAMIGGVPYVLRKIRDLQAKRKMHRAETATPVEVSEPDAALSNGEISWRHFQRIWDHALRDYRPRPLQTAGILFRARVSIYGDVHNHDGCLGWRGLFSDGLTIVDIPGDHVSMWKEPDVCVLSQAWQHSLGKLHCAKA